LSQNPILKALSVLRTCNVQFLLMGGQACVLYGAAEFSRDTDIAILADEQNLQRLRAATDELKAVEIAVPTLTLENLRKGHAVHFRCGHPYAAGIRLDVMSVLRGLPPFPELWERRTTLRIDDQTEVELLGLPELVRAKKTQRDKDWPQIRRLVEADYAVNEASPKQDQLHFWLLEARTPSLLREIAKRFPQIKSDLIHERSLLGLLPECPDAVVEAALAAEERRIREVDRAYWQPLKKELESL
jgi:hypothetical protein